MKNPQLVKDERYAELREEIEAGEYIDPMAPLQEEAEAPQLRTAPETRHRNDPKHRRLRAIAGAGVPYLFVTWPDGERATFDLSGMDPNDLPYNLRALADAVAVQFS